jgi:hypothetical protein
MIAGATRPNFETVSLKQGRNGGSHASCNSAPRKGDRRRSRRRGDRGPVCACFRSPGQVRPARSLGVSSCPTGRQVRATRSMGGQPHSQAVACCPRGCKGRCCSAQRGCGRVRLGRRRCRRRKRVHSDAVRSRGAQDRATHAWSCGASGELSVPRSEEAEKKMDEIFRMLGKEHEADLEREARKRRPAALARTSRATRARSAGEARWRRFPGLSASRARRPTDPAGRPRRVSRILGSLIGP